MLLPYTFATQSGSVPASELDANFTACMQAAAGMQSGLYSAKAFGCVGDGASADGANMNAALTAAADYTLMAPERHLLDAPISIPDRTTLAGAAGNPGQPQFGESVYARKSLLRVAQTAAAAVIVNRGSTLKDGTLVYSGLPAPPTTPAMGEAMTSAFAGTGAAIVDADGSIENMMIAGFNLGVNVVPGGNPGSGSRVHLRRLKMHNTNGIFCSQQGDIGRISDVHMWPYLYVDVTGEPYQDYVSPGYGLWIQGAYDQGTVERVFCFGYTKGFIADNIRAATFRSCQVDSANGGSANQPTGFTVENGCWGLRFEDCGAESQWNALNLDTSYTGSPTEPTATFIGGRFNANNITAQIGRGNYSFIGTTFGNSGQPCINIADNAGEVVIINPNFLGSVTAPIVMTSNFTGKLKLVLSGPLQTEVGFVGSNIPQSLIANGQVDILLADTLDIEANVSTRPDLQVGPQPRRDLLSNTAPANRRRWSSTVGPDGSMADQLLSDDELSVVGQGAGRRLVQIGGNNVIVESADLRPQFNNDAAAKAAGLKVRDFYNNTTLGYDVQIRA